MQDPGGAPAAQGKHVDIGSASSTPTGWQRARDKVHPRGRRDAGIVILAFLSVPVGFYGVSGVIGAWRYGVCSGEWMPALGSYRQDFEDSGCLKSDAGPILVLMKRLHLTSPCSRFDHIYKGGPDPN